ncbi:MAG: Ig-like domain-containing protein [Prevotellaceae bacterium]|nr:Ig-like domain-containing protein [Prevotellaceae bacterium]
MKTTIYSLLTLVMGLVLSAGTCSRPAPVTSITLHLTATTRAPGASFKITETVLPAKATDKSVHWTSSNPGVANVDYNTGLITVKSTATAPLTCTITAVTVSGDKVATCEITVAQNLNTDTPGWGSTLGTVTRGSERKIGTQIWSDVVFASACNKTSWAPRTPSGVSADGCRPSGAASSVTYFTWAAVVRYQDQLCPAPWRVPTKDDFVTLFQYLGGTGTSGGSFPDVKDKLVLQTSVGWGGAYGGFCDSDGLLFSQGSYAYYWSQSEASAAGGYSLFFNTGGYVYPQSNDYKYFGSLLRCVR